MDDTWDLIVVGGGAAGFFGAITAARALGGQGRILILEKGKKILSKVKISGGGRCNVTHDCLDPKQMAREHYPRGNKELIGPMHRFGVADTLAFFEGQGVALKAEEDGRIFPVSDDSQTIIDALRKAANDENIQLRTRCGVEKIQRQNNSFLLITDDNKNLRTKSVLIATGGTRLRSSELLPASLGHKMKPPVASLFTFDINDSRLEGLQGISVDDALVQIDQLELQKTGPLLITHRGLSGPGILKLSAWGARELADLNYRFRLTVNWLGDQSPDSVLTRFEELRTRQGKKLVAKRSPFDALPNRLWQRLARAAKISDKRRWAELRAEEATRLSEQLIKSNFQVQGKSTNKDEFVTCGGVPTDEVDLRTLESRIVPGVYFAGEVLDIDGITGGFNFQNAWTTGFLAGQAIAQRCTRDESASSPTLIKT